MDQELDAQKKKHSFLQWRLERLVYVCILSVVFCTWNLHA